MAETTSQELASSSPAKRWLTPLLITVYIVAILLISGMTRAKNEQTVAGSIGESTSGSASLEETAQDTAEIHR